MSKKIKIFALISLGIIVVIILISVLGNSSTPTPTGPLGSSSAAGVASSPNATSVPNDFSLLLSTVKSINIDTSIFTDPTYKTLRDHPIDLGTEDIGRPNPFAPVGIDIGTISGTGSTTTAPAAASIDVQTLQPSKVSTTSASFGARITLPDASPATLTFEYGPTDLFGSVTTPLAVTATGNYFANVTGLAPGTTYNVRAVLVQGSSKNGTTMVFTTTAKTR
jgi:hypothetical protein